MNTPKSLTEILQGHREDIQRAWDTTEAAQDFAPLPAGTYICRIVSGELFESKNGKPGYKLTFRVLEGEYAGRMIWHDVWLTPHALPMAKRDLARLGVSALVQLERPLPQGMRTAVKLALRRDDDGTERNRVRSFEVLGIDAPDVDPFAPQDTQAVQDGNTSAPGAPVQANLIPPDPARAVSRYE
ncbi:MAG: DUF669 domain-containing protein [Candidatus Hydrogenedentes bacterium]|nr:DUF669 domain-containing protein [Candidatus Hydrogenedentota bacterium]